MDRRSTIHGSGSKFVQKTIRSIKFKKWTVDSDPRIIILPNTVKGTSRKVSNMAQILNWTHTFHILHEILKKTLLKQNKIMVKRSVEGEENSTRDFP
jgi:hypothetical protein